MLKVIQFRAGAPDKVHKFVSGDYELIQRDSHNLCDYPIEDLLKVPDDVYFACSGDEDLLFTSTFSDEERKVLGKRLFLPYGPNGLFDVNKFYPKDSQFYQRLTKATGIWYPLVNSYTIDEFKKELDNIKNRYKYVVKVQKGSGSRGVFVINPDRIPQPGSREQYTQWEDWMTSNIESYALSTDSKILLHDIAYRDLSVDKKYNCNAIIRNGKLVLYKWNVPDNDSTNYDHAYFVRNEFTDKVVDSMTKYLVSNGITDMIFGFDGYTDYKDFISTLEVNWRYENSFFEFEAFNIDFMSAYLYPNKYSMEMIPFGTYPFVRYWRCSMFNLPKTDKIYE